MRISKQVFYNSLYWRKWWLNSRWSILFNERRASYWFWNIFILYPNLANMFSSL